MGFADGSFQWKGELVEIYNVKIPNKVKSMIPLMVYLGSEDYIHLPFIKDQTGIYLTYRKRNYYINQLSKLYKTTKNTYLKQLIEKVLNDEDFVSYFYTENDIVYEL